MEQPYVVYDDSGNIIEWGNRTYESIAYDAAVSGKKFLMGFGLSYTHYVDLDTLTIKEKAVPTFPEPPQVSDESNDSPPQADA